MANVAVIGAQWGDEGKGKVVDWLASRADIVVRFQGGHNAGHTLVVGNETYKLSLLPSGLVRGKLGIIGNGVVIDPEALLAEIDRVTAQGHRVSPDTLRIAENAALILPLHPRDRPRARGGARRPQDRHDGTRDRPGLRGQGGAPGHPGRRSRRAGHAVADKLDELLLHYNALLQGLRCGDIFQGRSAGARCSRWRRGSCPMPNRSGSGWTRRGGPGGAFCSKARRR